MKKKLTGLAALLGIPIGIMLLFTILAPGFGIGSIPIILNQSIIPLMIGFGLYIISLTGMFDFSVGVRILFAGMLGASLSMQYGMTGLIAGSMAGGLLGGVIIGLIYQFLKIPSMVAALGFVMVFEILSIRISGSSGFLKVSNEVAKAGSYPYNLIYAGIACVIMYLIYYRTRIGQHIKAVGNAENLAKNVGLPTDRIKFITWVLSGVFCGIGGIVQVCYSSTITGSTDLATMNLIFKPLIGQLIGIQFVALYDNVALLIFIGEIIIATIFNGFIALGMGDVEQNIVLGIFLILIMALPKLNLRHRVKKEVA